MTTTAEPTVVDFRARPMAGWKARLGAMASRGEISGPRVDEARAALSCWKTRAFLIREMGVPPERADLLLDQIEADVDHAKTQAEATSR